MKTLQILFIILGSTVFVYGQETSDKVVIITDNFKDNQVWYLKSNNSIEQLDSTSVKKINPNWIKTIEIKHITVEEPNTIDTIYIYIELKRRKYRKYLALTGHN